MYAVVDGEIRERFPNTWSTYHATHIEQIPFFHAYPGSRSLLVGTAGCNFSCSYCMNAYVAKEKPENLDLFELTPEKLVKTAKLSGCHNIVFGVNEVTVSLPSAINLAKEAKLHNLPMGCLSNGYMTEEAAGLLADHMSFLNISLKSLSPEFYQKYAGVTDIKPVLRNIEKFAVKNHLEITTPIVQSVNDHEIEEIAKYIRDIDPNIPWHVFRLLPEYKMKDYAYPDIEKISEALQKAGEILPYIYFSNFVGSPWVSTNCPECGKTVINRISLGTCGAKLLNNLLLENRCPGCGEKIAVLEDYEKGIPGR